MVAADHVPVLVKLALEPLEQEQQRRKSYFKLNEKILKNKDTLEEIKTVAQGKEQLGLDCSDQHTEELTALEDKLRDLEANEAELLKKRSWVKWLAEGETPSKYFFSLAKSRFAKETIHALEDDQGNPITSHKEILEFIQKHYSDLYDAQMDSSENRWARKDLLQLINRGISTEEVAMIDAMPEETEIELVVKSLRKGRAPGLDGVTADFIHECWDFLRQDCCAMVRHYLKWEGEHSFCTTRIQSETARVTIS
ncbi:hypothetical protein R1sor_002633 [Riccia sorocarpa]|uniref:Reverse transcriptase n=1 Tax=Riccia sorocarpa TaxID=122646 RepID=A0ABD3H3J1_9MARC